MPWLSLERSEFFSSLYLKMKKCVVIRTCHKNRRIVFNVSAPASFTALQYSECVFSDLLTKFPM